MVSGFITLVRHGKVAGPAALYGHTDIILSEQGRTELQHTLTQLHREKPIASIISSPLLRCAQVANEFSQRHALPLQLQEKLKEMNFGDWDGVDFNQLQNQWPQLKAFWDHPNQKQPPNGESLNNFSQRIISAWEEAVQQGRPEHSVIICHGGVIRIIIAHILGLELGNARLFQQLHIDYASYTGIELHSEPELRAVIKHIGASY